MVWPASASGDARLLAVTRALRGFADGVVSVLLASYLGLLGFSPLQIGALVTSTLLGSAALTLAVGLLGARLPRRRPLPRGRPLLAAPGLRLAGGTALWPPPGDDLR